MHSIKATIPAKFFADCFGQYYWYYDEDKKCEVFHWYSLSTDTVKRKLKEYFIKNGFTNMIFHGVEIVNNTAVYLENADLNPFTRRNFKEEYSGSVEVLINVSFSRTVIENSFWKF